MWWRLFIKCLLCTYIYVALTLLSHSHYDVTFNGKKVSCDVTFNVKKSLLLFFRGRKCVFYNLNMYVCGQLVDMCDSATHLGHFIASTDKKSIVKSAKFCFWRSFNILCLILVNCHILSNVNYLINIAALSMGHRCGL